jgi:hypothetical protein
MDLRQAHAERVRAANAARAALPRGGSISPESGPEERARIAEQTPAEGEEET